MNVPGWPPIVLEGMAYALLGQGDLWFDKGEIADAMPKAGFTSVESMTVDTPMMPMELDIARKDT